MDIFLFAALKKFSEWIFFLSQRLKNFQNGCLSFLTGCTDFGMANHVSERVIKLRNGYLTIQPLKNKLKLINYGGL